VQRLILRQRDLHHDAPTFAAGQGREEIADAHPPAVLEGQRSVRTRLVLRVLERATRAVVPRPKQLSAQIAASGLHLGGYVERVSP